MRINSALQVKPHKALLFLLFQCCTIVLWAQVRITGKVTGENSQGIPNISVQIQNTNFGTTTDEQGGYTLSANLKPGTYQVVFTGVSFRSSTQPLQVSSGNEYTINAQLSEDAAKNG